MSWDKAIISSTLDTKSCFRFSAFASDSKTIENDDKQINIDDIFSDEAMSLEEKNTFFSEKSKISFFNAEKIPLFSLTGRFLWFRIEIWKNDDAKPRINNITFHYPKFTYTELLPEIFKSNNSFLDRYVAVLQESVEELDKKIVDSHKEFDLESDNPETISRLLNWQGLDKYNVWDTERKKKLLEKADFLRRMRGTKAAMVEMVRIFGGVEPVIKENRTDSDNIYGITVYYNIKNIHSSSDYIQLREILNDFKPAGTVLELVLISPSSVIDDNIFLGENSQILSDGISLETKGIVLSDDYFDGGAIL